MSHEEDKVRDFYDRYGWRVQAGVSGEDVLFRDFSAAYYPYHERVNARTLECFAGLQGRLLVAGGGDMPETHVALARSFAHTTCLDISMLAIEIARRKLEDRAEFLIGSILDIPKPADHYDAVYCAHVIYHVAREQQAHAVRELIRVTRPGGRIVVIYVNLDSLPSRITRLKNQVPLLWKLKRKPPRRSGSDAAERPQLHFSAHPLNWWQQFADACDVELRPWDVMGNVQERELLVTDRMASLVPPVRLGRGALSAARRALVVLSAHYIDQTPRADAALSGAARAAALKVAAATRVCPRASRFRRIRGRPG
jgi:SAM-dependent methyltransferase